MSRLRRVVSVSFCVLAVCGTGGVCADTPYRAPHVNEPLGCGPRSVCVAARLLSRKVSEGEIRDAFEGRVSGVHSDREVARAARQLGLAVRKVRLDPKSPGLAQLPLIVAVRDSRSSSEPDHFLVLYGGTAEGAQLVEFPRSPRFVPTSALARAWDGRGLYVARNERDLPPSTNGPVLTALLTGGAVVVVVVSLVLSFRSPPFRRGRRTAT